MSGSYFIEVACAGAGQTVTVSGERLGPAELRELNRILDRLAEVLEPEEQDGPSPPSAEQPGPSPDGDCEDAWLLRQLGYSARQVAIHIGLPGSDAEIDAACRAWAEANNRPWSPGNHQTESNGLRGYH